MDTNFLIENGVDVNHGLELLGDIDFYNETMGDFLDAIDENINKLTEFKNNSDLPNYAIVAHSVKSDSKYLGFMHLADTALSHELGGKNGDIDFINNNFNDFINEINNIVNVAKKYLGRN